MKKFDEFIKEDSIKEFFGGPIEDLMGPRVDKLVEYLENYKSNMSSGSEETKKVDNVWNYLINDLDLDSISKSNRQGANVRGQGETIPQRVKRSIDNF